MSTREMYVDEMIAKVDELKLALSEALDIAENWGHKSSEEEQARYVARVAELRKFAMSDTNENNFSCQHCHRICDGDTRVPVIDQDDVVWKTIGSRYCNERACLEAEAIANGLPLERVDADDYQCSDCGTIGMHHCLGVPGGFPDD